MANTPNDEPGNEARHHGDRLGFPHPVADGTSLDDAHSNTIAEGAIVYHDGSEIQEATDLSGSGEDALGVLFTLPVSGDSSRAGPYVEGDKDATVGYRGSYTADLSNFSPTVGTYLDDAQNVFVKAQIDGDVYEVMIR